MSDREGKRTPDQAVSAETVETLVWLLGNPGLDRRRYALVNRLRKASERDEFATIPQDLRDRVHAIIADQKR